MVSDEHFAMITETRPKYMIYCTDENARKQLLNESSEQLSNASTHYPIRLHDNTDVPANSIINLTRYENLLKTKTFGRVIILTESTITSTQDVLRGVPFRAPFHNGTIILSKGQTKGRGRSGSVWETKHDSLCFSMECHVTIPNVPFIQYISALAISQCFGRGKTYIKWPNDVLCRNKQKIAGILCEGSINGNSATIVVGIGINMNTIDNIPNATSLRHIGYNLNRHDLLAQFLNNFEKLYDNLLHAGFQSIRFIYEDRWLHSNQKLFLEDENVHAVVVGIGSSGAVMVRRPNGSLRELPPDITSLDLNAGVLRKKVVGVRAVSVM